MGRRSARHEERAFVVEGPVLIAEAEAAGWTIRCEYVAPDTDPVSQAPVAHLAPGVLERVADTATPRGTLALVEMRPQGLDLRAVQYVVVVDRLADPGNLGTIMRSAEAAGCDAVIMTPGTVDPFNPKVVRASAGALFHMPVLEAEFGDLRAAGLRLIGTSAQQGNIHTEADFTGRVALVLGNEAHGLDPEAPVDEWVTIAHRGRAESLNVAMAGTVVCFEAARQRSGSDARHPRGLSDSDRGS